MFDAGRDLLGGEGDVMAGEHALRQQAAMALDRVQNDDRGLALFRPGSLDGFLDGVDIVAVDLLNVPAEGLELLKASANASFASLWQYQRSSSV